MFKKLFSRQQTWSQKLASIEAEYEDAEPRLASVHKRRAELVLPAAAGESKAANELHELDTLEIEIGRQVRNLDLAIVAARREQQKEQEAITAREARQREQRIRGAADNILGADRQVDAAMATLAAAFASRETAIEAYRRAGGQPNHRLSHTVASGTRAARFFGLHRFIDVAHMSITHSRPLLELDSVLLRDPRGAELATEEVTA